MLCHFCGKAFNLSFRQIRKNITTTSNDSKSAIYHHRMVPKVANGFGSPYIYNQSISMQNVSPFTLKMKPGELKTLAFGNNFRACFC